MRRGTSLSRFRAWEQAAGSRQHRQQAAQAAGSTGSRRQQQQGSHLEAVEEVAQLAVGQLVGSRFDKLALKLWATRRCALGKRARPLKDRLVTGWRERGGVRACRARACTELLAGLAIPWRAAGENRTTDASSRAYRDATHLHITHGWAGRTVKLEAPAPSTAERRDSSG